MNKKEKLQEAKKKLASLTDDEKKQLVSQHGIVTIEGRSLSVTNTMLVMMQQEKASVVGGYKQWKEAGRQVRKGESGLAIWFPAKSKAESAEDDDTFFLCGTVFDVTQTDEIEAEKEVTNG